MDRTYYNWDNAALEAPNRNDGGGGAVGISNAKDTGAMPGYMAMSPGSSLYERMECSLPAVIHDLRTEENIRTTVSSRTLVKPFEPLILQRQHSDSLPPPSSSPYYYNDQEMSLPATLNSGRPKNDWQHFRRFSLEEQRYIRPETRASTVSSDTGLMAIFRSTGALARGVFRSSSAKASSFLASLVRQTSLRKFSTASKKSEQTGSESGRHSRAYSEPPVGTQAESDSYQSPLVEQENLESTHSSLDLDEVVYDAASLTSAECVPRSVLRKIGIKPLVPGDGYDTTSSTVKLPLGPKYNVGTNSTLSSDSANAVSTNRHMFDDRRLLESTSLDSDNSDTDIRTNRRTAKNDGKSAGAFPRNNSSKTNIAVRKTTAPATQKPSNVVTLEPNRLSVNAKRRLRQNATKPLSGSYSRYDGHGSCESPTMAPLALMPPSATSSCPDNTRKQLISTSRRHQTYARFEIGGICFKDNKKRAVEAKPLRSEKSSSIVNVPVTPSSNHSPSPPAELAPSPPPPPPPPTEDHQTVRTVNNRLKSLMLPHSALPRLEGHIFKFPPSLTLNYAMLATDAPPMQATEQRTVMVKETKRSFSMKMKADNSVEYASIDQVATQAARKVASFRGDEARKRFTSTHTVTLAVEK